MYIIKVKGKKKIPDYIQLRDDNFTLIGYFSLKPGIAHARLDKFGFGGKQDQLMEYIAKIPFGKLLKLDL